MASKKTPDNKKPHDKHQKKKSVTFAEDAEVYEYETKANDEQDELEDEIAKEEELERQVMSAEFNRSDEFKKTVETKRSKARATEEQEEQTESVNRSRRTTSFVDSIAPGVQQELLNNLNELKGAAAVLKYNIWPGFKKMARGIAGFLVLPFIALGGAVVGIPATEVNTMVSGLNTAEGFTGVWERFKNLSKTYSREWNQMSFGSRIAEIGKRILLVPMNFAMGGISSFFNSLIANVAGGAFTVFAGTSSLKKKLEKVAFVKEAIKFIPGLDSAANAAQHFEKLPEILTSAANAWGDAISYISKWKFLQKFVSKETLKLWELSGNPLIQAEYQGDKDAILEQIQRRGLDLAKRFGATERDLQTLERLAKGDIGAINEVVKTFLPNFDIKNAASFASFSNTIKSTFDTAVEDVQQKFAHDYERIQIQMKDFLGLNAKAIDGVKKAFGEKALDASFQTIKTSGDNMVEIAQKFVENMKGSPLKDVMGYTLEAGTYKDALNALTKQLENKDSKQAKEFINKIHTFNILDSRTQKLTPMSEANLRKFKEETLASLKKQSKNETPKLPNL